MFGHWIFLEFSAFFCSIYPLTIQSKGNGRQFEDELWRVTWEVEENGWRNALVGAGNEQESLQVW